MIIYKQLSLTLNPNGKTIHNNMSKEILKLNVQMNHITGQLNLRGGI